MADCPNQDDLDDVDVDKEGNPDLAKSHPVNGIPASCRRVKLYEIYSSSVCVRCILITGFRIPGWTRARATVI